MNQTLTARIETFDLGNGLHLNEASRLSITAAAEGINANPLGLFDTLDKVAAFLTAGLTNPVNNLGNPSNWHVHQGGHHVALSFVANGNATRVLIVVEEAELPSAAYIGTGTVVVAAQTAPVAAPQAPQATTGVLRGSLHLSYVRDAVARARREAEEEARRDGRRVGNPFVRSRGTFLATADKGGDQCWPYPEADCPFWNNTRNDIAKVVHVCEQNERYAHVEEVYISGGFDTAERLTDFKDGCYEPWASSWKVTVWTRTAGWSNLSIAALPKDGVCEHGYAQGCCACNPDGGRS